MFSEMYLAAVDALAELVAVGGDNYQVTETEETKV